MTIKDVLIGKKIRIVSSTQQSFVGLEGVIVDETKFSFLLETKQGVKRIIKRIIKFEIDGCIIDGADIEKRSEERLK
jgi:RNase P/RNase MRP subunit p29